MLSPTAFGDFLLPYGDGAMGINVYGNLLIYGVGSLTINNLCTSSMGGLIDGSAPQGINIGLYGWYGGSLTVGFGTTLKVHTVGNDAIHIDNGGDVTISGASVELTGGRGVYTKDNIKVIESIFNVLSPVGNCIQSSGDLDMDYVFSALVSKEGNAIN